MMQGKLVRLRQREASDAARVHGYLNDRRVTQYLGRRYQFSLAEVEATVLGEASHPLSREMSIFAIETLGDGAYIGHCGLHLQFAEAGVAELGITIGDPACWSRGYGTDAVRLLVGFGFDTMNLHRIMLNTFDFNERGIAAYRKAGFVEEGRRRQAHYRAGRYGDTVVMSVLQHEHRAAAGRATA